MAGEAPIRPPSNPAGKRISIALVPEAQLGDFVIVHVGHAIGMLDEEEALASLALFAELAQSQNGAEAAKP